MCIREGFARKIPLLAKHGKRAVHGLKTAARDERKTPALAKNTVKILPVGMTIYILRVR